MVRLGTLMRYMLDANAFILLLAGHGPLGDRAAQCEKGDLVISAIAFGEVAHGSTAGKPPPPEVLERAIEVIPVLPFDTRAARVYASLRFRRGSYDRLIGAHALAVGVGLVTSNLGDFSDIPGLRVENWAGA
jgi:tRNA(fMet)-specific endonuclease VapC